MASCQRLGCVIQNYRKKLECPIQNWYGEPMVSDPGARRAEGGLTRKGVQTRQRIVAAAADLILQQGVAGTTLDDVRDEAGVSSSQIYHYFADKEALVLSLIHI